MQYYCNHIKPSQKIYSQLLHDPLLFTTSHQYGQHHDAGCQRPMLVCKVTSPPYTSHLPNKSIKMVLRFEILIARTKLYHSSLKTANSYMSRFPKSIAMPPITNALPRSPQSTHNAMIPGHLTAPELESTSASSIRSIPHPAPHRQKCNPVTTHTPRAHTTCLRSVYHQDTSRNCAKVDYALDTS